jgi:hypothetical protein
MGGQRRVGRRTLTTLAVLVLQLAGCVLVLLAPLDPAPHDVPVAISAPAVVASSLAEQVDARPGSPLRAEAVTDAGAARHEVESGRVVAALAIDLRLNTAILYVSSAQGDALTDAVSATVRAMAEPFAVEVTTQDVAPLPAGSAGQAGLRLAVIGSVVLGLVVPVVITWRRGPVADTWSQAARRVLVVAAAASVLAVPSAWLAADQVGGSFGAWWIALSLTMLATSAATLALSGVLGVAGIGVATLVLVISAAPLARVEHPLLLPAPWGAVTPWLPHGAGLDAARHLALLDGTGAVRPVVVLVAWIVVSCVALAVARRERRRAGVSWRSPAPAR